MSAGAALGRQALRLPGIGWWLLLALALAASFTFDPVAGVGIVAVALLQRARPLDFLTSFLLLVAGSSVVNYEAGHLTAEMSLLSIVICYMLFCYAVHSAPFPLRWVTAPLTLPMALFLVFSFVNFGRGLAAGYDTRFVVLEMIAVLSLACVFLAATIRIDRAMIATTMTAFFVLGCVHLGLGLYAYKTLGVRTGGIYFLPLSGVIASFAFPFVLREPVARRRWLYLFALTPMLVHQFLSYTRGLWFGLLATLTFGIVTYGGRGAGAGMRWQRALKMIGTLVLAGIVAVGIAGPAVGLSGLAASAFERVSSSAGLEMSAATTSNIVRLSEYIHVLGDIFRAPVTGYGLGYTFLVFRPDTFTSKENWYSHNNYLLVWLKQGIFGLVLFVWVMVAAFRTGWRGRHHPDPLLAAWCLGAAATALHLGIFCLVHFPLANVNNTFVAALIWGGAMSIVATGTTVVRWRSGPAPGAGAEP